MDPHRSNKLSGKGTLNSAVECIFLRALCAPHPQSSTEAPRLATVGGEKSSTCRTGITHSKLPKLQTSGPKLLAIAPHFFKKRQPLDRFSENKNKPSVQEWRPLLGLGTEKEHALRDPSNASNGLDAFYTSSHSQPGAELSQESRVARVTLVNAFLSFQHCCPPNNPQPPPAPPRLS